MSFAAPERASATFGPQPLGAALARLLPAYPAGRVLVAVSGGPDSAALVAALGALCQSATGLRARAVHVNHGLQPAAASFVAAARAQAVAAGLAFSVVDVKVSGATGEGVEAAARTARYDALAGLLLEGEALLTAHHEDDQAETLLLQLVRGAGLAGLSAMPESATFGAGLHLRPCLSFSRAALRRYAAGAGPAPVLDPMNDEPRFERAYLRRAVAPSLDARWPAWPRTLARAARHLAAAQRVLDELAAHDLDRVRDGAALDVSRLNALGVERRDQVLRRWLCDAGVRAPSTARLRALGEVLDARAARAPVVRLADRELYRHAGRLYLAPPVPPFGQAVELRLDEFIDVPGLGSFCLAADTARGRAYAHAAAPLLLKPRQGGERLAVAVNRPRRPVKDLLREAGIPAHLRRALPLLWSGEEPIGIVLADRLWLRHELASAWAEAGLTIVWRDPPVPLVAAFIEARVSLP